MSADANILQLPHISLKSRTLLPEQSGIYYVVDEKSIIWYIGKAKNLRTRWTGEGHHRLDQLQKQRKKQFTIYYELLPESLLDIIEQQRIEHYSPQLNGTQVKAKKLRPTETLLRQTLFSLAPYIFVLFVLGVESPRKEDIKFIEDSINWQDNWRVKKAVVPLSVIHICINLSELGYYWNSEMRFLRRIFRKRSNYYNNCEFAYTYKGKPIYELAVRRLLVNGFIIEVYGIDREALQYIQGYDLTQVANVDVRAVDEASLAILKNKCLLGLGGISLAKDNQDDLYERLSRKAIERIYPYKQDLVKLLFNEEIDFSTEQVLPIDTTTVRDSNTGMLVRLGNLANKKQYLATLLTERGIDLNRYEVNRYLEQMPKDDNYIDSSRNKRMNIFIKPFFCKLKEPIGDRIVNSEVIRMNNTIYGAKGMTSQIYLHERYKEVYLQATVDRVFWLLLETYLSDFAKVNLNEEEGYVSKAYVSPRRFIAPAIVTVTLNGKWKADIPFGCKDNMSYNASVEAIASLLQASGIPKLKFSFKVQSIRT